jgi:hypothetical protein
LVPDILPGLALQAGLDVVVDQTEYGGDVQVVLAEHAL